MKRKLLLVLSSLLAIGLLCGFALADINPDDNYDDELTGSAVTIVPSNDYGGTCEWGNEFAGSEGWSTQWYVLTWPGGGLEIQCYDGFWYGDFYSVWIVNIAGGTTVQKLFTTPPVETDWHHSCANPLHTGTGSVHSDGTHYMYLAAGTYEFRVRDELFHVLWAEGIDPTAPAGGTPWGWSPAGFYIGFHSAPQIIPEVPLGTIVSAAAMIVGLIAYIGTNKFRRRL